MFEIFASMDAVQSYLPHPLHRNTIEVTLDISEKGGGAIYFMPLRVFDSPAVTNVHGCMLVAWIWLSEAENKADIKNLIEAAKGLENIPGLIDAKFGPCAPTEWIGPDDTIDGALVLSFDSFESAKAAISHAAHKNLRNTLESVGKRHQWYSFNPDKK